jgi:hypothetical protein
MRSLNTFSVREAEDYDYEGLADALKPDWSLLGRHHWRRDFEETYGGKLGDRELDQHAELASATLGAHPNTLAAQGTVSDLARHVDPKGGVSLPQQNYSPPPLSYDSDAASYAVGTATNPQYYNPYPEDPPVQLLEQRRQPSFMERFNITPSYPPPPSSHLEQFFQDYIVPFLRNTYPAPKAPDIPKHLNSGRRADMRSDIIDRRTYE